MKKRVQSILGVGLLLFFLVACGGGGGESASVSPGGNEGGKTLVVATGYEASSLDPVAQNEVAATNAMIQIFENLLIVEENGDLTPALATSWEVKEAKTFTFHLREGVKFHNGEPLTASDVKFSLLRAAEAPAVASYFGDIDPDSFEIPDDLTLTFSLRNPNSAFLSYLSHSGAYITNQKAVEEAGDRVGVEPCGTGALKLESWAQNDKMVLVRNEDYWGTPADFEKLELRPIPEQGNRAIEVETGNVDIAYDLSGLDADRLASSEDVKLVKKAQNSITYLGFNLRNEYLSNRGVREAIASALDVKSMVESVTKGVGKPSAGYVPSSLKYSIASEKALPQQDVDKAKKLLADAGYPDGFSIRLMTNENPIRIALATITKEALAKIGISVTISNVEWTTFLEQLKVGDYDLYYLGWSTSINDPDVAMYPLLHSSASATGSNYAHFENAEFDALMDKGRLLQDGPEREQLYRDAQEVLYREMPFLPMLEAEYVYGLRSNIDHFVPSASAFNRLYPVVKK